MEGADTPVGTFKDSDFKWNLEAMPELKEGDILIHNQYLSVRLSARLEKSLGATRWALGALG
jgi:NADPH-dependent curcumin reductase CurA